MRAGNAAAGPSRTSTVSVCLFISSLIEGLSPVGCSKGITPRIISPSILISAYQSMAALIEIHKSSAISRCITPLPGRALLNSLSHRITTDRTVSRASLDLLPNTCGLFLSDSRNNPAMSETRCASLARAERLFAVRAILWYRNRCRQTAYGCGDRRRREDHEQSCGQIVATLLLYLLP